MSIFKRKRKDEENKNVEEEQKRVREEQERAREDSRVWRFNENMNTLRQLEPAFVHFGFTLLLDGDFTKQFFYRKSSDAYAVMVSEKRKRLFLQSQVPIILPKLVILVIRTNYSDPLGYDSLLYPVLDGLSDKIIQNKDDIINATTDREKLQGYVTICQMNGLNMGESLFKVKPINIGHDYFYIEDVETPGEAKS